MKLENSGRKFRKLVGKDGKSVRKERKSVGKWGKLARKLWVMKYKILLWS